MKMDDELLVEKYLSTIDCSNGGDPLFLITFIGLPGSGKTTIANRISEKTGLFVTSNDSIRRFLNENGLPGISPRQDLVQRIAEARTRLLYKNKVSHILDADVIQFIDTVKRYADERGASVFLIRVDCSEKTMLERISRRGQDISKANHATYHIRKAIHAAIGLTGVFFTIDSEKELDPQIDALIANIDLANQL